MQVQRKAIAATVVGLWVCGAAWAQAFPSKPVTLMVPYPAGGVSDVIARTLNTTLAKHLGQPVLVENLGGASGGIAAQKVLASPADGHMIFQGSPNELILAPSSIKRSIPARVAFNRCACPSLPQSMAWPLALVPLLPWPATLPLHRPTPVSFKLSARLVSFPMRAAVGCWSNDWACPAHWRWP